MHAAPTRPAWGVWADKVWVKTAAEWPLFVVLAVGAVPRALATLGFRPALYINDSLEYIGVALRWQAYPSRPDGYSAFLRVLLPFHSIALIAAVQHLMGLAIAVLIYTLLRHWRVRRWLAALAILLYLLDVHEIQLEHMIVSDTLFLLLLVAGITCLAWRSRATPFFAGAAGLLIALSALTRTVGIPILLVAALYLLIRWSGWRSVVTFVVLAAVPLAAYSAWFDSEHGVFGISASDGIYLYSRVMAFADCSVIKPPKDVVMLCDPRPLSQRPIPSNYIWHTSPLENLPGPSNGETALPAQRFTALRNTRARQFAIDAILAQPGAMLRTTWDFFVMSFDWSRPAYPTKLYLQEDSFSTLTTTFQPNRVLVAGATPAQDLTTYNQGNAGTHLVAPFAGMVLGYQHVAFLPGPIVAFVLALGFGGCVAYWRRDQRRWQILLLWTVAVSLLVLPALTAQFDNRYVLPALPFALAAAALSLAVLLPVCSTGDRGATTVEPDFDDSQPGLAGAEDRPILTPSYPRPADHSEW